ncbi:MAG: putative metalloprotease YpwA [candidate division WS6 bacterium OLB20]|uniref:Putative metalloprotease YpwA n=1 Tax=candidate division WS6 bacterium OLB20 TaxID=1617426 RepID=A0A136LXU5_9BACT|nr:MAG: putative metalloprotease YpwA [candidate division WS6 bacterium OLB20]
MTPLGSGRSLSIHESQSRLWENMIGRTKSFSELLQPLLSEHIEGFRDVTAGQLYAYLTHIQKQPLRVEADELSYHLHIIIRFELETALSDGSLAVKDLPEAWNEKYRNYLGIDPVSEAEGVLQDIHWSMGAIGYFPTYSIGTALSAVLQNRMISDGLSVATAAADPRGFERVSAWLAERIHKYGAIRTLKQTLADLNTGLSAAPLLDYLSEKYADAADRK